MSFPQHIWCIFCNCFRELVSEKDGVKHLSCGHRAYGKPEYPRS